MFLVDVSPSMGNLREVEVPNGTNGDTRTVEITNLEWSLQFVKLKIQEMVRRKAFVNRGLSLPEFRSTMGARLTSAGLSSLALKVKTIL